ncbi:MAG: SCO family protein [Chthoniobacteraceae bacterium]
MKNTTSTGALSESQFAALVDAMACDPDRRGQLTDLLREENPLYGERGSATIVRMRGWVLLAMARAGVSDAALIFVLEELDTGTDAYLIAAAACALRSYPRPNAALAPFVMRALTNIRYRDEPVSFATYGEYAVSSTGKSAVLELLATLAWLGSHARGIVHELELLRAEGGGLSTARRIDVERALLAIRVADEAANSSAHACCGAPPDGAGNMSFRPSDSRGNSAPIASLVLEDHKGELITFSEFFEGQPSIVAFFYTRCDNPMKCSLTITKLARIQKMLEAQGLADRIRTAAITYDPTFDLPRRLRVYGRDRGLRMDEWHRILRATDDNDTLRKHFELGVNFIESLVNRHRIELYIVDAKGRTAVSFERLHWDEQQVVIQAIEVLKEKHPCSSSG